MESDSEKTSKTTIKSLKITVYLTEKGFNKLENFLENTLFHIKLKN